MRKQICRNGWGLFKPFLKEAHFTTPDKRTVLKKMRGFLAPGKPQSGLLYDVITINQFNH